MLIIVDERGVERAASEHSGPDEIPERRSQNESVGETIVERRCSLDEPVLLADIVEDRKAGLRKLLATLEATSSDSAAAA